MATEPTFRGDSYVKYTRKCIIFPAEGSEPRIVDMTIRTVIQGDISQVTIYNRTVDLLGLYGSEYRKLRARDVSLSEWLAIPDKYLLYYNMSPKLPLNRCIARIIGVDPNELGSELFWRGDVVGMKFEPESKSSPIIQCYDADASAIVALGNALVDDYEEGKLEQALSLDEEQWKFYYSYFGHWGTTLSAMATGHHPYWGTDWRTAEADFLNDINELREFTGRSPIPIDPGLFEKVSGIILKPFRPFFSASHRITGPPAFPPELERRIFETCARSSPAPMNLVLVARRVRDWIDPILYETIILDHGPSEEESESSTPAIKATFEQFVANLDRKPPEFYSKHVKNLWISAPVDPVAFLRILTLCSGIENLVLFPWRHGMYHPHIPFQEHINSNSSLRRLTLSLEHLFPPFSTGQHFNYPFFTNITHLHLYDESEEWSAYTGFEHLRSLTHLAFACCGPDHLGIVMPKLPAVEYVALCSYKSNTYGRPLVNRRIPVEVYGIKVVLLVLDGLTRRDWEFGATGRADFWDVVEKEVTRRRTERYVGMT